MTLPSKTGSWMWLKPFLLRRVPRAKDGSRSSNQLVGEEGKRGAASLRRRLITGLPKAAATYSSTLVFRPPRLRGYWRKRKVASGNDSRALSKRFDGAGLVYFGSSRADGE